MRLNYIPARKGYGLLYNWYAGTDLRGIAPAGWHMPTDAEWLTFINTITVGITNSIASQKIRTAGTLYWLTNTGTNTFNTSFIGSGGRFTAFSSLRVSANFHSSSVYDIALNHAFYTNTYHNDASLFSWVTINQIETQAYGMSIRLIKDNSVNTGSMTGNDGKIYPTVAIGTQVWMAANLAETKYRSALSIQYGNLYNWYAATDVRGIAPAGWHLPTLVETGGLSDFAILAANSGVTYNQGTGNWDNFANLVASNTEYWNTNWGLNTVGFNLRGASRRVLISGGFNQELRLSTSLYFNGNPLYVSPDETIDDIITEDQKYFGFSIRLVKDDSTDTGSMTDYDGNVYPTVKIGNQVWMAANLIVEHFNNGDAITNVSDNTAWAALTTAGMCYYNNDINNSRLVGDTIPNVTDNTAWAALTTGACCAYNNDPKNV